jgi:hypothetical protein
MKWVGPGARAGSAGEQDSEEADGVGVKTAQTTQAPLSNPEASCGP